MCHEFVNQIFGFWNKISSPRRWRFALGREKDSWELTEDRDSPMPFCLCILYCLLCELEVSHYFNINLHFLSQFGWSSHKCSALPTKKELVQVNFSFWNLPSFPPFLFPPSPSPLSQPNSALPFKKKLH